MSETNNCTEEMFPYEIKDVDPEKTNELHTVFKNGRSGCVQVGPEKYLFSSTYRTCVRHFWNFQSRHDDVWVTTFPRSGTTWTQELVWLIANDLNFTKSAQIPLTQRFPLFEINLFVNDDTKHIFLDANADDLDKQRIVEATSKLVLKKLSLMKERRFIKTHFPFSLLPPTVMGTGAKVVYVARNPKDVIVSYYYLNRMYMKPETYVGDFSKFCDLIEHNLLYWTPYWSHLREGWENRHQPNVLFLFYEDMIKDLRGVINKVASFLGKSLSSQEVDRLCSHLHIDNFKRNPSVNLTGKSSAKLLNLDEVGFVRNGQSFGDGWQPEYTPEIIERVERWMEENLSKTDMRFPR